MLRLVCQSFLVCFILVTQVEGSCFIDRLIPVNSTNAAGLQQVNFVCEYVGIRHNMSAAWSEPYPHCLDCRCEVYGMECCSVGASAGAIEVPEQCQFAPGMCEARLVRKDDPTKPCNEDEHVDQHVAAAHSIKVKLFALKRKNATFISRTKR